MTAVMPAREHTGALERPASGASSHVEVVGRPTMNLLGLLLAEVIDRRLGALGIGALRGMTGDVLIRAGRMVITLQLSPTGVRIERRTPATGSVPQGRRAPRARVEGSLDSLMALSLGGNMVLPVLTRALKVRGDLLLLLKLSRLLRVDRD